MCFYEKYILLVKQWHILVHTIIILEYKSLPVTSTIVACDINYCCQ